MHTFNFAEPLAAEQHCSLSRCSHKTMRTQRQVPASWTYPLFSSWKSLVVTCLALSQVITIGLLLRIAGNGGSIGEVDPVDELSCPYDRASLGPRPHSTAKFLRRVMSVVDSGGGTSKASARARAAAKACVPQTISPGQCSDEARAVRRPVESQRETCAFELDESEVVFGVWHSLATEGRLQPLLETWGKRAQVVLLASSVGVRESKFFTEGVPGSRPHLLGENLFCVHAAVCPGTLRTAIAGRVPCRRVVSCAALGGLWIQHLLCK